MNRNAAQGAGQIIGQIEGRQVVGLDIAKNVFQLHTVDMSTGEIVNMQLKRAKVLEHFANRAPCLIGIEACGGAPLRGGQHDRCHRRAGHLAGRAAAWLPKFVGIKSLAQQATLTLHRQCEMLMKMKAMQTNALRGLLYEFEATFAKGRNALFSEIEATLERLAGDMPQYVADSLREQAQRIKALSADIKAIEVRLAAVLRTDRDMLRVAAIPGVGLLTATAVIATMGQASAFKSAREFCAWLGLVPKQRGTGGRVLLLGISKRGDTYPTVRRTIDLFEAGGWAAIRPALRGRDRGDGRVLNMAQEQTIQRLIIDQRPEQLKMDFSLWSRAAVGQLIEQEFGIALQVRTIGKYLARWGFTPQKPIRRAYEQSPAAVQSWLDTEYPAIDERARREGGEIHWGDETALVNTDVRGRSYAPMGKTPVAMAVGGTRHKLSMIATVTNQGKTRWMIIDDAFDADKLIEFLQALIKDADKKVFLILDNLRVHHSKKVKAWVAEREDQIELFYLPSYSPQLNPEERLNADLKREMGKRVPIRTKTKLRQAANEHMAMLDNSPERVMSYFQDRRVQYAA